MPKVTVDGLEIDVPAGATVLQACELTRMDEAKGSGMLEAAE